VKNGKRDPEPLAVRESTQQLSFGEAVSPFEGRRFFWPNVLPLGDEVFEFFGNPKTQFKKCLGIDADGSERTWSAEDQLVFLIWGFVGHGLAPAEVHAIPCESIHGSFPFSASRQQPAIHIDAVPGPFVRQNPCLRLNLDSEPQFDHISQPVFRINRALAEVKFTFSPFGLAAFRRFRYTPPRIVVLISQIRLAVLVGRIYLLSYPHYTRRSAVVCWTKNAAIGPCTMGPRYLDARRSLLLFAAFLAILPGCRLAADGQNQQGVRLFQQGQFQPALQKFQQALATDPLNADAYYNMAASMHSFGTAKKDNEMLSQAETLYNYCLDVDENHVDCHRGLAVLLKETGREDRAFALLKNWAKSQPSVSDAYVELARVYEESGDLETAMLHLNQAVGIDQANYRAWAAFGHIREETGDTAQALTNYQRSLDLNQFQSGVAERVATLSGTVRGNLNGTTLPGGTRTVAIPRFRY
jgi:Flp pilus assembly protein TadD